VRAVLLQIDSLKTGGPSAPIMQKVREAQLRDFEIHMKENGFWIGHLMQRYVDGQDPRGILEFPDFVRRTDAKAVQKAARRWFDTRNLVKAVLLPETDGTP
jgi:zinc protease